jgi:PHP domain
VSYIELHSSSAFSFLRGASLPETLVERAAALGYPAIALLDRDGVYGAPRFHAAAKAAGIRAIIGAELTIEPNIATSSHQDIATSHRHITTSPHHITTSPHHIATSPHRHITSPHHHIVTSPHGPSPSSLPARRAGAISAGW